MRVSRLCGDRKGRWTESAPPRPDDAGIPSSRTVRDRVGKLTSQQLNEKTESKQNPAEWRQSISLPSVRGNAGKANRRPVELRMISQKKEKAGWIPRRLFLCGSAQSSPPTPNLLPPLIRDSGTKGGKGNENRSLPSSHPGVATITATTALRTAEEMMVNHSTGTSNEKVAASDA
jgi:hypothetical protein